MDLTTAGLVSDIQLNALLPDGMFDDADIVSFLNDAFFSDVLAFVMRHREDFFVTYTDYDAAASISIPADAISQKLKDIQLKKSSTCFVNMARLSMGEITSRNHSTYSPEGFYIQDNTIYFYPNTPTSSIRLVYYQRPKYMIDSDDDSVYTVTAIDGTDVTVNKAPTVGALTLTLSKSYQPFDTSSISCTGSITDSNHLEMSADDAATVTVGDIFCPSGYCAFPKLPLECRDVLVQSAIVKIMIAMKDKDGYAIANQNLKEAKASASSLISPRIDNEVKKIVNTSTIWNKRCRY